MIEKIKENTLEVMKYSAVILLTFISMIVVVTSILFLLHISIGKYNLIISLILTVVGMAYLYKDKDKIKMLVAIILAALIFSTSIAICSRTYDLTWDGNTYHKLAVGMMKDGWNPIYENAKDFIKSDISKLGIIDDDKNSIWIEHYPKASWTFSANIYEYTNNIESAKILPLLIMYIGFCIIVNYLNKKMNLFFAILLAFLAVVNPISVVQTLNFYIDGLMGICIYIIIFTLVALSDNDSQEDKKDNWLVLTLSLIICINLKFTGLVYSAVFCFMFFVLWIYRAYKDGTIKERLKQYIIYYSTVVIFSLIIVGFSPYVKNIISKGNPLYPLMGKDKVDIITYNEPKLFIEENNSIKKFFISMFSVSENIQSNGTDKNPELKIPFSIKEREFNAFNGPDLRISGFGIWFSGIFVISVICIIYFLIKIYKNKEYEKFYMFLAFIGISILLVAITDGSWWARYVPYIYLFPIIASIMAGKENKKIFKAISLVISILLIINTGTITYKTIEGYSTKYSMIKTEMKSIKKINKKKGKVKVALLDKAFSSVLYNLRDKNIRVKIKDDYTKLNTPKYVNRFYYSNK